LGTNSSIGSSITSFLKKGIILLNHMACDGVVAGNFTKFGALLFADLFSQPAARAETAA
jgi:hypothetical protein